VRGELEERKITITSLQTELVNREIQLQQALQSISSPAVVSCENETQTVDPEPEEPEHLEEAEPITETTVFEPREATPEESEPDTTEGLQTEAQPKLLNPKQLAEWINKKHKPEKPVEDYSIRDWFKKNSTCSDKKRAEVQEKYGFKFSHCDKKGTLWFTVG